MTGQHPCWACDSLNTSLLREGVDEAALVAADFRITDANYGSTGDIYQCADCGLRFCPTLGEVLHQYEAMDDPEYEATREQRLVQARNILKHFAPGENPRLLDVGAGSGILVEAAGLAGFDAKGVEPSHNLADIAVSRGLPVLRGTLDDHSFDQPFGLVCLIDVLEHVTDPLALVGGLAEVMDDRSRAVIITPDVSSLLAKVLGRHWWHYRIAHVSYFDRKSAEVLLSRAGLEIESVNRPGWCLPADYLFNRVMSYLPAALRVNPPSFLGRINIPLNLGDSLMLVCRKQSSLQLR
ncbi:MAG: class I SAM-dependent methyltransferase [Pseudomonadota bacterium]